MGSFYIVYELRNEKTGEAFTGTANEVAEKFGLSRGYISRAETGCGRILTDWTIKRVGHDVEQKAVGTSNIPMSLFKEWDKVTAQFKQASRSRALC